MAKKKKKITNTTFNIDIDEAFNNAAHISYEDRKKAGKERARAIAKRRKEENQWVDFSNFKDGYDFGDVTKSILGTGTKVQQKFTKGVQSNLEGFLDTGTNWLSMGTEALGWDKATKGLRNFAQKDFLEDADLVNKTLRVANPVLNLYAMGASAKENLSDGFDATDIGKTILQGSMPVSYLEDAFTGEKSAGSKAIDKLADYSVTGNKLDELTQTVGQITGQAALTGVGIPWQLTAFANSAGNEMNNAFQNNATAGQAFLSGLISGAVEVGTEYIGSGANKLFGMESLGSKALGKLGSKISNKAIQYITKIGFDGASEGLEEVLSGLGTAIGQKLTYMSDKDFDELYSSDQALDDFVMGALGSVVTNIPNSVGSVSRGENAFTGLTENEKTVLDKEIERRTNDLQKNGKELTKGQKKQLEESVQRDLQKGYISADFIEETLGKDFDRSKDNYLQESFRERIRSNFRANIDTSNVKNEFEKATLESANRFLDGTNKARETAEIIAKLSKDTNTAIEFTNNNSEEIQNELAKIKDKAINKLTSKGMSLEEAKAKVDNRFKNATLNGMKISGENGNKILINADSPNMLAAITGHEITHLLEKTNEYKKLRKLAYDYAKMQGDERSADVEDYGLYDEISDGDSEYLNQELTADLVGDYIVNNEDFIRNLYAKDKNVFQKIKDFIDDLVTRFTGTDEERKLRECQRSFERAIREYNKGQKNINLETTQQETQQKTDNIQQQTTEDIAPVMETKQQVKEKPKKLTEVTDEDLFNINMEEVENQFDKQEYKLNEDADDETSFGNYWDLDDYNFKLKDGNTLWIETPREYGKYKNGKTNYQQEIYNKIDFMIEDSNGEIIDEYSIENEKGEFTRDDILNAIKHMTYDDSNKVADGQLDIFDNVHRNNGVKYSLSDYQQMQENTQRQIDQAYQIGEDFGRELERQYNEYREKNPLQYEIYEKTDSKQTENVNDQFFKEHESDYDGKSGTNTPDGKVTSIKLQKGDNLAKLSYTENEDKIWIDELYVKNQKQGYGSEIVNAIKDYADRNGKYVEAFKELQSAKGFWDKTLRKSDTRYSLGKHYGDLGKGNDTYYFQMANSRRSTGHFGTGTYFVNENYQPGESSSYANRPSQTVEFNDYNLFRPSSENDGFDLHDALKQVNYNNTPISKELYDKLMPYYEASFGTTNELLSEDALDDYQNIRGLLEQAGVETEPFDGNSYLQYERDLDSKITDVLNDYDYYNKAKRDLQRILGIDDTQFENAIEKVRETEKAYENMSDEDQLKADSLSTVFMKELGYNGIDVRGYNRLDNTEYGSVIYDLDNKINQTNPNNIKSKDEKINNLLLTNSDVYDMVDSSTLRKNGLTVEDLTSRGLDDIDKLEDAWRKANYENSSKDFHEIPIEDAVSTIRNNDAFWRLSEGWFRGADSAYKPNMEKVIIMNPELRNAGINIAYQNYKDYIDNNISFDDFINKEIPLYRGSNESGFVDADKFIAFSYRKDMVEKHFANRNKEIPISEIKVKIKDTLGSYQTTGEAEVLVPRSIADKNNIRYSLSVSEANTGKDNQGRTLSKGMQEYMADSKVTDENGNLIETYHGTNNPGFNIFKPSQGNSQFGKYKFKDYEISYHTASLDTARGYTDIGVEETSPENGMSNIYRDYLNITNPFVVENSSTSDIKSWKNIKDNNIRQFETEYYDEFENKWNTDKKITENLDSINEDLFPFNCELRLNDGYYELYDLGRNDGMGESLLLYVGENDNTSELFYEGLKESVYGENFDDYIYSSDNVVKWVLTQNQKGANYDGIIIPDILDTGIRGNMFGEPTTDYITFYSNQVKSVDNQNPTKDPDIRYSLSPSGEMQDSNGNKVTLETSDTGTTGTLMALHNLGEEKFNGILDLDGIPVPSIAVTNPNIINHNDFGDGTLLFDKSTINPAIEANEVYDRDVWTPTFKDNLQIDYEINNDVYYDTVAELLVDFARGDLTIDNFKKLTRNDYQTIRNVSDSLIEKIIDDMNSLKNLPTDYFEAKPQRAVGLDEIQMAVIPNNWSEQTKQRLQDKGIKYVEYDPNVEGDRQRVINQFDELKWSLTSNENITPRDIAPIGGWNVRGSDIAFDENKIKNALTPVLAPIQESVDQLNKSIEELKQQNNLDDLTLDITPFLDMINGTEETNQLSPQNLEKAKQTLVQQGVPVDAAQSFLENMVNRFDTQFNKIRDKFTEKDRNKVQKMILDAQEKFTNRNAYIDKLAKDSGNEMIKYKGDLANNSFGQAQYNVQNAQTNLNGEVIGKGVNEIFSQAKKQKLDAAFEDYLFNKSNIERHAVGKGSQVPAAVSEQMVIDYEKSYPQFKAWSKDIETYYDNLLNLEIESGLIDQDTYNLLRGEEGLYRSYVPFYPSDAEKRYFDDAGDLKPMKTLKRAEGGANRSKIMGIQDAMTKQTMAVWQSMRTNQLYQEIINTLGGEEGLGFIVRNDPSNLSQSLYTDQDGNKFLTAYVNGQEMSTKISDELYNELSKKSENAIKEFEDKYSLLTKPLQGLSSFRRNVLTSWNPIFALYKNPVKDIQDAVLYSKHTAQMLKELPSSYGQLLTNKTKEAQQFRALYGGGEYSGIGKGYARVSDMIELAPRFAEFKASLKAGESVEQALYNARDITTNFGRGGYVTKALNRNGFTFLNASVQGFSKFYRNFAEQPNAGQFAMAVGKAAMLGVVPAIFNELAFGGGDDKDEDYEAQPDYIKDNYYLFKKGNGEFIRIPKGRALSVMGSAARRTLERIEGEEDAFDGYLKNAWSQIGPVEIGSNPLDNTIVAPIAQVLGGEKGSGGNTAGRAWYGGDIVPYRLQGERPEDQSDASVDKMSIWLGEKLGISPYKINYVIDQYTGGLGDLVLPMMTEETNSGAETPLEYAIAPIKDQIVVNSIDDNKYASEFYSTKEKLYTGSKATDKDLLKAQYMNDVSFDLSALYKEKRAIQSDSSLGKKEKYKKVQQVQKQINEIAKEGLDKYEDVTLTDNYASVGDDRAYYKNTKGKWTAIKADELNTIETLGLTDSEKSSYFDVKNKIYNLDNDYKTKKEGKSEAEQIKLGIQQKKDRIETIKSSTLPDRAKYAMFDTKYDDKLLPYYEDLGFKANDIMTYKSQTFTADKDKYGDSISGSKKTKVLDYINSMNIPYEQKLILWKKEYKTDNTYDRQIVSYIDSHISDYSSKKAILEELGYEVNGSDIISANIAKKIRKKNNKK